MGRTTILLYHAIGGEGEQPGRYVVPRWRFELQMAWLALMRRRVVGLEEVGRALEEGARLPRRSVVLTFDDGYRDVALLALPILRSRGFPATCFIATDGVGRAGGSAVSSLDDRSLLSWDELREMRAGGLTLGAHSRSHPPLRGLPEAVVREEVEGSRRRLEQEVPAARVTAFAYPHGDVDDLAEEVVRRSGFLLACAAWGGRVAAGSPRYRLPRVAVDGRTPLIRFPFLVSLGMAYPEKIAARKASAAARRLLHRVRRNRSLEPSPQRP
jgi:peptidoglycan/xylan/chitin deacetylase (PgdA/CDA1 family)